MTRPECGSPFCWEHIELAPEPTNIQHAKSEFFGLYGWCFEFDEGLSGLVFDAAVTSYLRHPAESNADMSATRRLLRSHS